MEQRVGPDPGGVVWEVARPARDETVVACLDLRAETCAVLARYARWRHAPIFRMTDVWPPEESPDGDGDGD